MNVFFFFVFCSAVKALDCTVKEQPSSNPLVLKLKILIHVKSYFPLFRLESGKKKSCFLMMCKTYLTSGNSVRRYGNVLASNYKITDWKLYVGLTITLNSHVWATCHIYL